MIEVRYYYPNEWRKNVGDLVPRDQKRFNWFICSKRYTDSPSGLDTILIPLGTKFYDEKTGISYVLPKETKAVIVDNISVLTNPPAKLKAKMISLGYNGLACLTICENPGESVVCPEALFSFVEDSLEQEKSSKKESCPIIRYSKANYKCISSKIPGFPTPAEIDETLAEGYPMSVVCRVLYEDILSYTDSLYTQ